MKVWSRMRAANTLWLLALGSCLLVGACGGDEGVTPVCPTIDDCTTPPGQRPAQQADAGTDADDTEADASGDESDE